ncbi:MAG: Nif3-like dinuclear metal center hexameric protein [Bacteroidales bacterium]
MKVRDICSFLDSAVPLAYQESYDNSGLQAGNPGQDITSALLSLDATPEIIEEAVKKECGMVITHHPVLFHPLKSITGKNLAEQVIIEAVKNNIAIYCSHTNLDVFGSGVSRKMAEKLGLNNIKVLKPLENKLIKLITFVPVSHADRVRKALFSAGAGVTGNYDMCSFNTEGYGTFRANESASPYTGKKGEFHRENEVRIETILPLHVKNNVVKALLETHPYEEVAFDIYPLLNEYHRAGVGCSGNFRISMEEKAFLGLVSEVFNAKGLRHSVLTGRKIKNIALCGGAGASLIDTAVASGADAYITGEIRYHDFLNAGKSILLADIGHYESEIFCLDLLHDLINKKFPKFALRFSEIKTNPINYY